MIRKKIKIPKMNFILKGRLVKNIFIAFIQDCLWNYQLIQCLLQYEYVKNTYIKPVISAYTKICSLMLGG